MPDLSHAAVMDYWFTYVDPTIYRVLAYLESVEPFTRDNDPTLEASLAKLATALDREEIANLDVIAESDKFIRIVGNIKSSRGLRLLQAMDMGQPGSASRILTHAEQLAIEPDDPASVFLKRNIIFERFRLLTRVFSEYRLYIINKALETEE